MINPFPNSKILIVDDDTNVQKSLKRLINKENFVVQVACDGEDALSKITDFQPHCILLDIKMPYLNGKDTLKMIKFSYPTIEVIIISGINSSKINEDCLADGACSCVSKPVNFDFLFFQIIQALELRFAEEATD
jgi:DNA-binding response OmpR family regulator